MRDKCPRDAVHLRIADGGTVRELGQFAIEAGREVVADFTQLFVDDMEVLDQPFRGRRDRLSSAGAGGEHLVRLAQGARVIGNPGQQRQRPAAIAPDRLSRGEALGVLSQSLDTEELGANRLVGRIGSSRSEGVGHSDWRRFSARR